MKKHIKCMRKIVTLIITFISIINILPMEVLAGSVTDAIAHKEFVEDVLNNPTSESNTPDAEILFEVKEKRDEHTKVYKKSDGSYTAIITEDSLHYLDDGEWEEINNSMFLDDDFYTNTTNLFNVEFPEKIDSNESLTVENDGYELSFIVDNISESTGVVENNTVDSGTDISVADEAISQTQSSITYTDVAEDTDLQYIVTPTSIKENIIVSDKDSVKDTYTFTFETNGLTARKLDDGSVVFKDEFNEIKFRIPRPVMNDANFAFSYDIDVALTENADETITLEYSPSIEWTSSSERVYPVTIDPAIIIDCGGQSFIENIGVAKSISEPDLINRNYKDVYIAALANNIGQENINEEIPQIHTEIYTRIDTQFFKGLGNDIVFTEVQYLFYGATISGGQIFAREIIGDWNINTVTYNTKPGLSNEKIDCCTLPLSESDDFSDSVLIHFNITKLFNEWYIGKDNKGFAVTADENTFAIMFLNGSSKNTAIVLDYIDLGGYDENLNYHTQEAGRAGTGYVNDFTRTLSVIRDDIKISDTTGTIGMIYNSASYKKLKSLGYNYMLAYGNNWLPNYLKAIWVDEENGGNVTYYTGTGSAVGFACSITENNEKEFKELYSETYGDHGYQLEYKSNEYIITRPDGYVERFNRDGLLVSVTAPGKDGETINIAYYPTGCINTITDSDGKIYTYDYDEDSKLLSGITIGVASEETDTGNSTGTEDSNEATNNNENSFVVSYNYDKNGNLETVTFPDSELPVLYEYNDNNDMTSMQNIDGYRIKYDYENNRIKKVTEQAKIEDNNEGIINNDENSEYETGNSITYESLNSYQVKLTDATGAYEIYHFGNWGNLLYTIDSNGKYVLHGDVDSSDITHYASTSAYREFSENLLSNSSFEELTTGEDIHLENWANTNKAIQSAEVNALFGSKVLKISNNSSISQTINDVSSGNYIFSAYVFSEAQNGSLNLTISYNDTQEEISKTTSVTTNGNWDRYMVELDNIPAGKDVTVKFEANGGTFYIDGAQLECADSVSLYNYIQNGSFNDELNDGLNHWGGSTGLSSEKSSIDGKSVNALKLPHNQATTISQTVAIDGKSKDIIRVGGWFKGYFPNTSTNNSILEELIEQPATQENSVAPEASENQNEAYIEVICSANQKIKIPFNENIDDWQFAGREFSLDSACSTVTVTIHYSENITPALLANLELTKTKIRTTNSGEPQCPCVNCKIINCSCNCGSSMNCYCKQCMREDENAKRDSFGNLILGNNYDEIITAQQLTQRVADSVTVNWNLSNGFLKNVYDAAKAYTTHSYNASGDITEISANGNSVEITYDKDRITTINQNGTTYSFAYDGWGQLTGVFIGDEPIVSYTYDSGKNRDRIIKVAYGNSDSAKDTIIFNYDDNDNSKIIVNANGKEFTCHYNPNGTLRDVKLANEREIYYNNGETKIWVPENDPTTQADTELLYSYDVTADGNISETIGNGNFITSNFGVYAQNNQFIENMKVTSEKGKTISFSVFRDGVGRYGGDPSAFSYTGNNTIIQDFFKNRNEIDENSDSLAWINDSDTPVIVKTNYDYYDSDGSFGSSVVSGESTDSDGDATDTGSAGEEASTESGELKTITLSTTLQQGEGSLSTDYFSYEYTYRYDDNNNIVYESISDTDPESQNTYFECHYVYDNNNQLVRVNQKSYSSDISGVIPESSATYFYDYDNAGNLVAKKEYEYTLDKDLQNHTPVNTIQYNYESNNGWKDKLITFDNENITYDNIGNPIEFIDSDTYVVKSKLTWNGKLLKEYVDGDKTYKYEYDVNGLCCRKTVFVTNTEIIIESYDYIWSDGRLTGQVYTDSSLKEYSIKYIYDIFNSPYGFIISGSNGEQAYLYLKNLKGDIFGIVNESGNIVSTYEYDPWGALSCSVNSSDDFANVISKLPITYRGYCYDYDTELYYIQGRWYNPETGRFINADNISNLGSTGTALSYNLYAYCENNPVMYAINNKNPELANTINSNYLYNKRISKGITGYIDEQHDGIASKLRYGITAIHPLGCGWIATYNALIMLGNKTAPCDLIRDFEMNNLFYYGTFGTNGNNLARYLSKQGYDVTITYFENNPLDNGDSNTNAYNNNDMYHQLVKANDANILFYKNDGVGHFITIRYDETENVYVAYNDRETKDNKSDSIYRFISENDDAYKDAYVLISISNNKSSKNNSAD